jgi:hypothetical protein
MTERNDGRGPSVLLIGRILIPALCFGPLGLDAAELDEQ